MKLTRAAAETQVGGAGTSLTPARPMVATEVLRRPIARSFAPGEARRTRIAQSSRRWERFEQSRWPLTIILAIQVLLALRLVWSNTAFQDEALYIWVGHMDWSHWLHGTPMPDVAPYLSGAPSVYPPLAAYADSIAGLAGARFLSLIFMLIATTLLHGVARRIFDRRTAYLAAALFVGLAGVQYIGSLATYDAMALMFMALATWFAVRGSETQARARLGWLLLAALALTVANLAKYASLLFDPVVLATAALLIWRAGGLRTAIRMTLLTGAVAAVVLVAFVKLTAPGDWAGFSSTTLSRQHGQYTVAFILYSAFLWTGIVVVLAILGSFMRAGTRRDLPSRLLAFTFTAALFLAPLSQARMHVITSLFKHVSFGAWFGTMPAAFALATLASAVPPAKVRYAKFIALAAVVAAAIPAFRLDATHYNDGWPNTTPYLKALRPVIRRHPHARMLFDQHSLVQYYLTGAKDWNRIYEINSFNYRDPKTGVWTPDTKLALSEVIQNHAVAVIGLITGVSGNNYDQSVVEDVRRYHGYHLVANINDGVSSATGRPQRFVIYEVNHR